MAANQEELTSEEIQEYVQLTSGWVQENVFNVSILSQALVIVLALLTGIWLRRKLEPQVINAINKLNVGARLKRFMQRMRRMVAPVIALLVLFPFYAVLTTVDLPVGSSLLQAAINLMLAWVLIKFFVQFISNPALRNIFGLIVWTLAALNILGVLDESIEFLDSFAFEAGNFRLSALSVTKAFLSLFVLTTGAVFVSSLVEGRLNKANSLTPASRVLFSKMSRVVLVTLALLIAVAMAGIDLSVLAVFGGAVGLGIGFGLQKVISNLFSGMLLLLDKSIKPGDIIELQSGMGGYGWVNHMGARYTSVITRDNKEYLIPNEDFITQQVINWSHTSRLIRVQVQFGVSYDADPHEVIEIAKNVAVQPTRVVHEPPPVCVISEFGDSSVNYYLRFWIEDAEKGVTNVKGEIMLGLWDAFKENNIEIPFPQRVVHMVPEKKTTNKKAK